MITHQKQQPSLPSTQAGFTIIESLLAVILVTILLLAVAPVIAISVATRLQARRVEQATEAARAYMAAVRTGTIPAPLSSVPLLEAIDDGAGNKTFDPKRETFAREIDPPSSNLQIDFACRPTTATYPYCWNNNQFQGSLYCADGDGNGCSRNSPRDFIVQGFRSISDIDGDGTPDPPQDTDGDGTLEGDIGSRGYLLGVRVYRADAFDGKTTLTTTAGTAGGIFRQGTAGRQAGTYAGGTGDRSAPLVEITTEIGGQSTNYQNFCDRLGGCIPPAAAPSPSPS